MAFGDVLGKMAGSFFDEGSRGQALSSFMGNIYDIGDSYFRNRRDQEMADAALRMQAQVAQQQMNNAATAAQDERAVRQRMLDRAAQLDRELQIAQNKLGARADVDAGDIYNNYQTFRTQIMDDYNDTLDRISSQGYADAIRRGMDRSTQMDDERATLARKAAEELPKLDQAAFDAAIQRSQSYADSLNYGRDATLKEVNDMYNAVANMEAKAMPSNTAAAMNAAYQSSNSFSNNLTDRAVGSQDYMGNALANFSEKIAPNARYALTGEGNFFDAGQSDAERELAFYRANSNVKYQKPE